jgi:hypothetical protein
VTLNSLNLAYYIHLTQSKSLKFSTITNTTERLLLPLESPLNLVTALSLNISLERKEPAVTNALAYNISMCPEAFPQTGKETNYGSF